MPPKKSAKKTTSSFADDEDMFFDHKYGLILRGVKEENESHENYQYISDTDEYIIISNKSIIYLLKGRNEPKFTATLLKNTDVVISYYEKNGSNMKITYNGDYFYSDYDALHKNMKYGNTEDGKKIEIQKGFFQISVPQTIKLPFKDDKVKGNPNSFRDLDRYYNLDHLDSFYDMLSKRNEIQTRLGIPDYTKKQGEQKIKFTEYKKDLISVSDEKKVEIVLQQQPQINELATTQDTTDANENFQKIGETITDEVNKFTVDPSNSQKVLSESTTLIQKGDTEAKTFDTSIESEKESEKEKVDSIFEEKGKEPISYEDKNKEKFLAAHNLIINGETNAYELYLKYVKFDSDIKYVDEFKPLINEPEIINLKSAYETKILFLAKKQLSDAGVAIASNLDKIKNVVFSFIKAKKIDTEKPENDYNTAKTEIQKLITSIFVTMTQLNYLRYMSISKPENYDDKMKELSDLEKKSSEFGDTMKELLAALPLERTYETFKSRESKYSGDVAEEKINQYISDIKSELKLLSSLKKPFKNFKFVQLYIDLKNRIIESKKKIDQLDTDSERIRQVIISKKQIEEFITYIISVGITPRTKENVRMALTSIKYVLDIIVNKETFKSIIKTYNGYVDDTRRLLKFPLVEKGDRELTKEEEEEEKQEKERMKREEEEEKERLRKEKSKKQRGEDSEEESEEETESKTKKSKKKRIVVIDPDEKDTNARRINYFKQAETRRKNKLNLLESNLKDLSSQLRSGKRELQKKTDILGKYKDESSRTRQLKNEIEELEATIKKLSEERGTKMDEYVKLQGKKVEV